MNKVVDVFSMIVVVAGIMVLVRPGSQGPQLVDSIANLYTGSLAVATGSGLPQGFQQSGWFQRAA
jgi:hypothetical protein